MLDESIRIAVLKLHEAGNGVRSIARALNLSRGAVRKVVRAGVADVPRLVRAEKGQAHLDAIRELHARCKGNLVRVHEELQRQGATLSYQALTAFCRRHGIGHEPPKPSGQYHFEPGQEMQHDTSPHRAKIGGAERLVQTASLVLAYSRLMYFQLYPSFTRFACKVFLTEAVKYFGGAAGKCVIDNTHVVVLHGTGAEMVPVPEMEAFGKRFGFEFMAHEKGDANRSARVERPFDFIENNFLAGREFTDIEHANREALIWCDRVNATRKKHLHASPRELFAAEASTLKPLPLWVPDVYRLHQRIVDLEGYIHVEGHIYSVPYQLIGRRVEVRETKDEILIFDGPRLVAKHRRLQGPGKQRITEPKHRPPRGGGGGAAERPLPPDEKELREAEPPLPEYAANLKVKSTTRWPLALRRLLQMWRDYPRGPFLDAVTEATHYGLYDVDRLERMVLRHIAHDYFVVPDKKKEPDDEG